MEEEEVQTAAGFSPRGQRSWETAGQSEDERSMPRLDEPELHVSGSKVVDRVMGSGGESVKRSKLKATKPKAKQKEERGQSSLRESQSRFMHRNIVSVDLTVGV